VNWIIVAMVCLTVITSTALVMGNWSKVRMAQVEVLKLRGLSRGPGE